MQQPLVIARALVLCALALWMVPGFLRQQSSQQHVQKIPLEQLDTWHLQALPGIGPVTAEKILQHIEQRQVIVWPKRSREWVALLIDLEQR